MHRLGARRRARAQERIGEPFTLGAGESTWIVDAGIRVGFDSVLSDSRCPLGVECIWEGNATARVWGETSPSDRTVFELSTNPRFQTEARFRDFKIQLLHVVPYPEDGVIINPDDYIVTILVVRAGEPLRVKPGKRRGVEEFF